jgi:hypothetical protein
MKSKVIALSAISSAIIAVLLTLGAYIEIIDLLTLIIASVLVILPLYYKSYLGSMLCFLAGGVIAFLCSGFNILSIVFPAYFGFAGIYPIIKCKLMDKNFNKMLTIIIGLVWCVLAFYGMYFYYVFVIGGVFDGLPDFFAKYILYLVGVVGVIFYFVYDRFVWVIRMLFNKYLSKVIK